MNNERKNGKKRLKINAHHCKSMTFLFNRYFKRNKVLTVNILLTPLVYIIINIFTKGIAFTTNHDYLLVVGNSSLFITYLIQTVTITMNFMIYAVNDMKQSVVFRRIGLTRINRKEFYWSYFNFSGLLTIFSYILITIVFLLILSLIQHSNMFWIIIDWQWIINIIVSLLVGFLLINLSYYFSIILFNKMWLNLITAFSNVVIVMPLFVLTLVFSTVLNYNVIINTWAIWQIVLLIVFTIAIPIALGYLFYFLANKQFKWER